SDTADSADSAGPKQSAVAAESAPSLGKKKSNKRPRKDARTSPVERRAWAAIPFPTMDRLLADPEAARILTQCRVFHVRLEPDDYGLRIVRDPNTPPPWRLTQAIGRLTDRLRILLSAAQPIGPVPSRGVGVY